MRLAMVAVILSGQLLAIDMKKTIEFANEICSSPSKYYKSRTLKVNGELNFQLASGNVSFKEHVTRGIKDVLDKYKPSDNVNLRACKTEIVKLVMKDNRQSSCYSSAGPHGAKSGCTNNSSNY